MRSKISPQNRRLAPGRNEATVTAGAWGNADQGAEFDKGLIQVPRYCIG